MSAQGAAARSASSISSHGGTDAASASQMVGDHMKEGFGLPAGAKAAQLGRFQFDAGDVMDDVVLAYSTYGSLNAARDNCVIVGHSLTSNSCVHEWWAPLIGSGPQYTLDTSKYFIVCANYLGSVYGSSSPLDINPRTGRRWAADFPLVSIRDNVRAQKLLLDQLGVRGIAMAIGGSLGGMLALEWAATYPAFVRSLVLVATCARHTDWAIGLGEAGRQAVYADAKWRDGYYDPADPPLAGLSAARQLAMLSYRTPHSFTEKFGRAEAPVVRSPAAAVAGGAGRERLAAASVAASTASTEAASGGQPPPYYDVERYLNYQGEKFIRRFDPLCYIRLTQLLDSHDVGRGRGSRGAPGAGAGAAAGGKPVPAHIQVLRSLPQPTLVVGIASDLLYPLDLQLELASSIRSARLYTIHSPHGHDAFLIEIKELNVVIAAWAAGKPVAGLTSVSDATQGAGPGNGSASSGAGTVVAAAAVAAELGKAASLTRAKL